MNTILATSIPMLGAVRRQPVATKSAAVRRRYIRHVAVLLAIGVALALVFVWIRVQVIQLGYELSKIRRDTTELLQQKQLLEADVASLKSLERLEEVARERFGMRTPQSDEIVYVQP